MPPQHAQLFPLGNIPDSAYSEKNPGPLQETPPVKGSFFCANLSPVPRGAGGLTQWVKTRRDAVLYCVHQETGGIAARKKQASAHISQSTQNF